MKIEVKEYTSEQIWGYENGEFMKYSIVKKDENKLITIFKGELNEPSLTIGDNLYIEKLDIIAKIIDIPKTISESPIVVIDSYTKVDKTIPRYVLDEKIKYDKLYLKYNDHCLTNYLGGFSSSVYCSNDVDVVTYEKFKSFGVYITDSGVLTKDIFYNIPSIYYKLDITQRERFEVRGAIEKLKENECIEFIQEYVARKVYKNLNLLGIESNIYKDGRYWHIKGKKKGIIIEKEQPKKSWISKIFS